MPPIRPKSPQAATQSAQTTLYILIALLWYGFFAVTWWHSPDLFWDAKLYARSLHTLQSGGDPYTLRLQENFVYSPIFLRLAGLLSRLLTFNLLAVLYLAAHCTAVLVIPFVVARFYLQSGWFTPPVALLCFAFHPGLNGQIALLSGNVSSILYATVLLAGIPGIRRNHWTLFYLAIALGAMIKPQLLSLFLLPIFLGQAQLPRTLITALAVASAKVLERAVWPADYAAFLKAAFYQVVILNDSGIGLVRYFVHYHLGQTIPLLHQNVVYLIDLILTSFILLSLWALRRAEHTTIPQSTWRATILVTAILANPRIMPYEAAIAIMPATLLIVDGVKVLYRRRVSLFWLVPPLASIALLSIRSAAPAVFCWLLGSVLLVLGLAYRRIPAHPVPRE